MSARSLGSEATRRDDPAPILTEPAPTDGGQRGEVVGFRFVARQVLQFALAGLVAVVIVGWATTIGARRIGKRQAIDDARSTTVERAQGPLARTLSDGVIDGDPAAIAAVADSVERSVLDHSLVRVKIWTAGGKIVYSDESRLIGTTYQLGTGELASLRSGRIEAEISDLTKPENRFERTFGRLLEVYLPVYTPSGNALLFEAYYRYSNVQAAGATLFRAFAPITLGSLVVLQLVQLPLAFSLARRLRQRSNERSRLLQRAVDASDIERRQIAADLHDGVVQDLAGVAFALAGAARQPDAGEAAPLLDRSAAEVRHSIQSLRTLLVDIYPPNLDADAIEAALADLAAATEARGPSVEVDAAGLDGSLAPNTARLLYRATQEALRNVVRHAEAGHVTVDARVEGDVVRLAVTDDGRGFDEREAAEWAAEGHFGLRGLTGLVEDAGGSVAVLTRPGDGTRVEVEVPVR